MQKIYFNKILLLFSQKILYFSPLIFLFSSGVLNFYFILFVIACFLLFFLEKKKLQLEKLDLFLLVFFLLNIVSSIINLNTIKIENLEKSIFLLRYFLIYYVIKNLVYYNLINIDRIAKIAFYTVLFLSIDINLQFITGFNFFGYRVWDDRYNGFFEHESVAGSYIQKIFPLILIFLFFQKKNLLANLFTISFFALTILFTGDRTPFFFYLLFLLLIGIFYDKKYLISFFSILLIFFLLFSLNNRIKTRYNVIILNLIKPLITYKNEDQGLEEHGNFLKRKFNIEHQSLVISAIKIGLERPVFGWGNKSFRIKCFEKNISINRDINYSCSTHPHNIYAEIFVTCGFLGLFSFLIFFFIIIKKIFENRIKNFYSIIFLCYFFVELFPFKISGSLFSTFNAHLFWYLLSILYFKINFSKKH